MSSTLDNERRDWPVELDRRIEDAAGNTVHAHREAERNADEAGEREGAEDTQ
jgi:hypothetical protein